MVGTVASQQEGSGFNPNNGRGAFQSFRALTVYAWISSHSSKACILMDLAASEMNECCGVFILNLKMEQEISLMHYSNIKLILKTAVLFTPF